MLWCCVGSGVIYVIIPVRKGLLSVVGAEMPPLRSVGSLRTVVSFGSHKNSKAGTLRPTLCVRRLLAVLLCVGGSCRGYGGMSGQGTHKSSSFCPRGCQV